MRNRSNRVINHSSMKFRNKDDKSMPWADARLTIFASFFLFIPFREVLTVNIVKQSTR